MRVIVIDPGHGGRVKVGGSSANNAVGPGGMLEKHVTLELALRMAALPSIDQIRLTRNDDTNLGLADRAHVARDANAAVFLSIHLNGFDGVAQGTETWVHGQSGAKSLGLAKAVQRHLLAVTGLKDRGVKRSTFGVLAPRHHAAGTAGCLVEVSFMDVAAEEARLRDPGYLQDLAEALMAGIRTYLDQETPQLEAVEVEMHEPEDGFEVLVR